jgi:predicted mannosyl-3-phosphoglycerate phosphatase (HAD superfamily)
LTTIACQGSASPAGIIFTNLDDTLLDFHGYSPSPEAVGEAREILRRQFPVIPANSKTGKEIRPRERSQPLTSPAIAQGGDAWNDLPIFEDLDFGFDLGDAIDARVFSEHAIRVLSRVRPGLLKSFGASKTGGFSRFDGIRTSGKTLF